MYWKEPLWNKNINEETEKRHMQVLEMLPAKNYVRLQPELPNPADRIFDFDACQPTDNEELCSIAC